jgi:hypothetical protein
MTQTAAHGGLARFPNRSLYTDVGNGRPLRAYMYSETLGTRHATTVSSGSELRAGDPRLLSQATSAEQHA